MCPRIAEKDRAELPKPMVKIGTLGFFPLNSLGLSYRHVGLGDTMLGLQDSEGAACAVQTEVLLKDKNDKSVPVSLNGFYYRNLSDALYRGKLPQVVLATPSLTQLSQWSNEILDYTEKMLSLGFMFQTNAIDKLFPYCYFGDTGALLWTIYSTLEK